MGTRSKDLATQVLENPSSLTFTMKVLDWIPVEPFSAVTQSVEWAALIQPLCPAFGSAQTSAPSFPFMMLTLLPVTQTSVP